MKIRKIGEGSIVLSRIDEKEERIEKWKAVIDDINRKNRHRSSSLRYHIREIHESFPEFRNALQISGLHEVADYILEQMRAFEEAETQLKKKLYDDALAKPLFEMSDYTNVGNMDPSRLPKFVEFSCGAPVCYIGCRHPRSIPHVAGYFKIPVLLLGVACMARKMNWTLSQFTLVETELRAAVKLGPDMTQHQANNLARRVLKKKGGIDGTQPI